VFFQVRGQADVHYPSPDEPWSNTYGWTNPGWDPLAYAITAARSRGLEFHAYFNTHTLAAPLPPVNTTPQHPFNLHGPNAPGETSWMIRDSGGNAGLVDSYYWISPANTEASAWTRKQAMYLIQNYPVDGIHFDRIRSPGSTYTFDAATQRRWNNGQISDSNPDALNLGDFMRSQITRDLRNIQGAILHWNYNNPSLPLVKSSAAPFGIVLKDSTTLYQGTGTQSHYSWFQDSWGWLRYGTLDFMVPQIYWQVGSSHPFESLLTDWINNSYGRHIVAGSTTGGGTKTTYNLLREHLETRNQSAAGHTIFSQNTMGSHWDAFRNSGVTGSPDITVPYDQPTTTPQMPWRTNPTSATIVGTIVDTAGNPIVDAKINLPGDIYTNPLGGPYNYLSAHDGFFAILGVTPGSNHQVLASKSAQGSGQATGITLTAGQVTSITIVLSNSAGTLSFDQSSFFLGSTATLTLRDDDLAGQGTVPVSVSGNREATPETLVLTEETSSSGTFTGGILLSHLAVVNGDGLLQSESGDSISAVYLDADIGNGTSSTVTTTATVTLLQDIILESRLPDGNLPPASLYTETANFPGVWGNTSAKSTAPGLGGQGGRYIGNDGLGATATFRALVPVGGLYDVSITLPGAVNGPNNHSPGAGWRITHDGSGGETTGTVDISRFNTGMTNAWLSVATGIPYNLGSEFSLTITNNHAGTANTGNRLTVDAVRLSLTALPVAVSVWELD
jgi:uncharacterized lipoprotein YddW (UPF0748 family)